MRKVVIYRGAPMKLSADFLKEILQARMDWKEIFKVMKSKNLQPRLLYPPKLLFRIKEKIKHFPEKKTANEVYHH